MEQIFMGVAGGVGVIVGVLMIINRSSLTKFMADAQRATFGKAGDKVAAQANPWMTAIVGAGFVLLGAAMVVLALAGADI
ncbi:MULTISPECIES: hypothetical protein [unclassified Pseudarthrobacter]|uniref:hypothetical protein n=1 Tax=unclassified Pseudarthrobacter TaxID=2647000 RepID=UPI00363444D3